MNLFQEYYYLELMKQIKIKYGFGVRKNTADWLADQPAQQAVCEMPVELGPCDEWLNNTVCVWRFSWLVSLQVIGGDWTCGDVWRMKIWCHADGLRAVKGGSRLAFEGFEIVRCMSTVPDDTARERWWTVSWLSHKTKIPDVRCGGRGRRRGQLSIARRFRIVVRRDHGTPWC